MSQDIAFSSLFIKVVVEMLMWLDSPNVEGGPLKTLLKSFAGQNSHKHMHSDGERPSSVCSPGPYVDFPRGLTLFSLLCSQCEQVSSTSPRLWNFTETQKCR